jgi:hypothetical protein
MAEPPTCCFCDRLEADHDYEGCRHCFVADPVGSYAKVIPEGQWAAVGGSNAPSEPAPGASEPSLSGSRTRRRSVSVTSECACCGRAFVGRRSDAQFCGDVCKRRSRRGRCEENVA